jgi:hypothetical protein
LRAKPLEIAAFVHRHPELLNHKNIRYNSLWISAR